MSGEAFEDYDKLNRQVVRLTECIVGLSDVAQERESRVQRLEREITRLSTELAELRKRMDEQA